MRITSLRYNESMILPIASKKVTMRTSSAQLPTAQELMHILSDESQRKAVRFDFLDNNQNMFYSYRELAKRAGVDSSWIDGYKTESLGHVARQAHETTDKLSDYILGNSGDEDLLGQLFDSLVIDSQPESADAIFVFGSPSNLRAAKAVELFSKNVSPVVIVSGRGPHYGNNSQAEADRMAEFIVDQGVPHEAIMVENQSITLPDNVKRTLDMFALSGFKPSRICIVATTYIVRRAYMEWYKFTPWDIEIFPVSAEARAPELLRESWFKSEKGVRMLLNEYAKMVIEHKMDLVRLGPN